MKPEKYFGIDNSYQYMNLDERYGDRVPVKLADYEELNPSGSFFEWYDGIFERLDGGSVKIAEVRLLYLEDGESPLVTRGFAQYVLMTCLEGGSNWWADFFDFKPEEMEVSLRVREKIREGGRRLVEFEEGETGAFHVTEETIRRGVQVILSGETDIPEETVRLASLDWSYYDLDSPEADAILQAGIFGRRVFRVISIALAG